MTILKLEESNLCDYFADEEPFPVIGRLSPKLENGVWTYGEQLFDEPREKQYPPDEIDLAQYLKTPERAIFLAYEDGVPVGRIVLRRNWNRNAFVEDIAVRRAARGRGVGSALLARAGDWARGRDCTASCWKRRIQTCLPAGFIKKRVPARRRGRLSLPQL